MPVASLGSTNFAKHRYKSFDNAHGPGRRYIYNAGVDGGQVEEQSTRDTAKGKGKGKGKEGVGQLEIWRYARRHRRRYQVRTPAPAGAPRRPNVSDDVADIANYKNYHRGTSPAPYFLTSANPRASRPGFEFDATAGNLDVSFNAKPQRRQCRPSMYGISVKTFLISHSRQPVRHVFN